MNYLIKAQFTYQVFKEIARHNSLNSTCENYYEHILQHVCQFTGYRYASAIMLKKEDLHSSYHFPLNYFNGVTEVDYSEIIGYYKRRILTGNLEIIDIPKESQKTKVDSFLSQEIITRYNIKAQVAIPLISQQEVFGLLIISDHSEKKILKGEQDFYSFIGSLISEVLSGKDRELRLHNKVVQMMISLKGSNRRFESVNAYAHLKKENKKRYSKNNLNLQNRKRSNVHKLARMLEIRDYITEEHSDRLQNLLSIFGIEAGFSENKLENLLLLGKFHDIGKVGIPDRILLKPGALTLEERAEMQKHSEIGYNIAKVSQELLHISDFILKHHEWWNGQGYPLGIAGERIPLECRMLAIADAYDAMINDRPYRKALHHNHAIDEICRCAGKQFDPRLVEVFVQLFETRCDEGLNWCIQ